MRLMHSLILLAAALSVDGKAISSSSKKSTSAKTTHSSTTIVKHAATTHAATTAKGSSSSASSSGSTPTVTLDYCTVAAAAGNSSLGYYKYQNIRFAAVPTGTLRWAEPISPPKETSINTGALADEDVDCSSSEDCLYLDVWAPANSKGKNLPVMVWTYGGGFTGGSKSQNTPEGLFNLTKDFIFVAYNYRLGLSGLGNGVTLPHEGGTTNTAIWDVQHAFQWVRKYIGDFGGNPNEVTAVGFSAGGSQTLFQMTRFAGHAEQLFDRAYVMSPGFVPGAGHHHAEQFWQNVSTSVGCDGGHLSCMRAVNFTTLNTAASTVESDYNYQFQPRVDGDIVADTYESEFYQKRFNFSGPVVITHEQHEANSAAWSGVNTTADVSTYLRIFFPAITDDVVAELLELYPETDYTSPGLRFSDMKQSLDLTAHNLALTNALGNNTWNAEVGLSPATHGTDQSYYWYSTYSLSSSTSSGSMGSSGSSGPSGSSGSASASGSSASASGASASGSASASASGASASGTASASAAASSSMSGGPSGSSTGGGMSSTSVNSTIAIMMQKYLMSFVLTGNPNTIWPEDKLTWPKYGSSAQQIVFNDTFSIGKDDLANARSLYWNKALWY